LIPAGEAGLVLGGAGLVLTAQADARVWQAFYPFARGCEQRRPWPGRGGGDMDGSVFAYCRSALSVSGNSDERNLRLVARRSASGCTQSRRPETEHSEEGGTFVTEARHSDNRAAGVGEAAVAGTVLVLIRAEGGEGGKREGEGANREEELEVVARLVGVRDPHRHRHVPGPLRDSVARTHARSRTVSSRVPVRMRQPDPQSDPVKAGLSCAVGIQIGN
jgi:hypothetical protein